MEAFLLLPKPTIKLIVAYFPYIQRGYDQFFQQLSESLLTKDLQT
ncbi:hypothetical protein Aazo_5197 ['Nostoc azollae' 0708]|jgi:hypothetical protein|uniref:Uncharacterized protein n=1 Tax=Nostoc azollae (strain 0708) TaxID=551115 RepID=D7E0R7_NOSA0|nr:hypothetical protein Aazo_5197 ['Nostoc azollae' 0708]